MGSATFETDSRGGEPQAPPSAPPPVQSTPLVLPPVPPPSAPAPPCAARDVDAVLSSFGIRRRFYPVGVYFLHFPVIAFFSWQMFVLTFAAWEPESHCATNLTRVEENCTRDNNNNNNNNCSHDEMENCTRVFDASPEESIVVEWNLVSA